MQQPVIAEQHRTARTLYITYDGLTDPLGQSQVLPYVSGLAELGHSITILSCEKRERMVRGAEQIRKLCGAAGIGWHPLTYHKTPPVLSSAFDAAALTRGASALHQRERFDIVHCRSYIAARAGLALKRRFGVRLLFDMRGFWPDEKVEGNSWNLANPIYAAVYRYFKRLEAQLLRGADHIVSLTEAGKAQLLGSPELAGRAAPISVIPCCVDFDHFRPTTDGARRTARDRLGLAPDQAVLGYLGSLGSWYMLEEMLDFFKAYAVRKQDARFLFVTTDAAEPIRNAARARGVDPERLAIVSAARNEVPGLLAAADVGIFFIKPVFSKTASSPTKMGEMLAVGLPIVTNAGVGDVAQMVEQMRCGVAVSRFDDASYAAALDELESLDGTPEQIRASALPLFDVQIGIERYDRIYRELLEDAEKPIDSSAVSKRLTNSSVE